MGSAVLGEAISSIRDWSVTDSKEARSTRETVFGSLVFNDEVQQTRLPKNVYHALRRTITHAEALDRPAHQRLHVARSRHVGHSPVDGAEPAQLARGLLHARRVVRAEDDARPAARETLDGRPPHPGRATGDDRHLPTEVRELGHALAPSASSALPEDATACVPPAASARCACRRPGPPACPRSTSGSASCRARRATPSAATPRRPCR